MNVAEDGALRRSVAEEARTVVAGSTTGMLATVGADGAPWASVVAYAVGADGAPVLVVSTLAEHGRNLRDDPRASLAVGPGAGAPGADPLDAPRVTLAGRVHAPGGDELAAAHAAYRAAFPAGAGHVGFGDMTTWVLAVERVRWVGGYARMGSADGAAYGAARPDPVAPHAAGAVAHLNADHADALLDMARALAGHPGAVAARCLRADRYGLDLEVDGPQGTVPARVAFRAAVTEAGGLRGATVELARRARTA